MNLARRRAWPASRRGLARPPQGVRLRVTVAPLPRIGAGALSLTLSPPHPPSQMTVAPRALSDVNVAISGGELYGWK